METPTRNVAPRSRSHALLHAAPAASAPLAHAAAPLARASRPLAAVALLAAATLRAGEPAAHLSIAAREIPAGARDARLDVHLDSEARVYGFQLSLATDPALLELEAVDLTGTAAARAEFSSGWTDGGGGHLSWGVMLDVTHPFDPQVFIPPGSGIVLARVVLDVTGGSSQVASVRFEDRPGPPAARTMLFREGGLEIATATTAGQVTITAGEGSFLRADSDANRTVNLTDGVFTLNFLFRGGPEPQCRDAADADDNGRIELTDAVYTFRALFAGGAPIPAPFPDPGPDPTADGLGCAQPLEP